MGVGGGWWIADGGQRKGVEGETAAANSNLQVKGVGGGGACTRSSSLFDKRGLRFKIIFISVEA